MRLQWSVDLQRARLPFEHDVGDRRIAPVSNCVMLIGRVIDERSRTEHLDSSIRAVIIRYENLGNAIENKQQFLLDVRMRRDNVLG